jgi:ribulose kinase
MKVVYNLTRQKRFLVASIYQLQNEMVTCKLVWALENIPALRVAAESGDAMFGTLDTWLVYKLTGGRNYVGEISNAAGTGDTKAMGHRHWQCRDSGDSDILCSKRQQNGKDSGIEGQPLLLFM